MADTGGIAALLKALNDTPALGAGLSKPSSTTPRTNAFARAAGLQSAISTTSAASTAGAASTSATSSITSTTATKAATAARPIRSATTAAAQQSKPKTLIAEGVAYNAYAPRGTYLNLVV
jgi:hypothetical protein